MPYQYYQPNIKDRKRKAGDCAVRAISKALNRDWLAIFDGLTEVARKNWLMPDSKQTVELFLEDNDFEWVGVNSVRGKSKPTVKWFAKNNPKGVFVLRVANHIVACVDGIYYDTWDCGDKTIYGIWSLVGKPYNLN